MTKNPKTLSESKKCKWRKKAMPRRFTKVNLNTEELLIQQDLITVQIHIF